MIRFYHKNRHRIANLRKHGWLHFEKPTDRKENDCEKSKNYGNFLEMLWVSTINKNSGSDWSLRPPLASAIYFALVLEYVMDQFSIKNYRNKYILIKENQMCESSTTYSGLLKILTLANGVSRLHAFEKAATLVVYSPSGAHFKQEEELFCDQKSREGKEGSGVPLEPTLFRFTSALPASVPSVDTPLPVQISSTFYSTYLKQPGCENSFEPSYDPTIPLCTRVGAVSAPCNDTPLHGVGASASCNEFPHLVRSIAISLCGVGASASCLGLNNNILHLGLSNDISLCGAGASAS